MARSFNSPSVKSLIMSVSSSGLLALALAAQAPAANSSNAALQGKQAFSQGNYQLAASLFQNACAREPGNAEMHYWYASSLAKLYDGAGAIQQYRTCLQLDPPPAVAAYARKALTAYFTPHLNNRAGGPVDMVMSRSRIDRQAQEKDGQLNRRASRVTAVIANSDNFEANRVNQEGVDLARDLRQYQTRSTQSQIAEAEQYYASRANNIRSMESEDIRNVQNYTARERQRLKESAAGLQEQMLISNKDGSALSPVGTNLYVRNYMHK